MKVLKCLLFFPLLFFSLNTLAYEGFSLSPEEEMDSGPGMTMARNDYEPSYKFNYDEYSRNRFVGQGKVFIFDPKLLRWYAYYNGNLVNTGRASGGKLFCPDIGRPCRTPTGSFIIQSKGGPECKSRKYPIGRGNAPMPWCMFFHRGFAIHGSWDLPNHNASHGCIRVHPMAARWLNVNFLNHGTKVIVKSYGYRRG